MDDFMMRDEELDVLRDKSYMDVIKKGYKVFKGCTLPSSFEAIQKEVEDLEVYDDDVWVTSFPKCGTTWMQEMVWCLCNNVDLEMAKTDLNVRFPTLEHGCLLANFKDDLNPMFKNNLNRLKNLKRPRFIKCHLPWELLPKQITTFEKRPKIIHVSRNPKDCCVSYYHHSKLMECFVGDFDAFWRLFLGNRLFWTPFTSNVLSYWSKRNEPNVLFIKYEDMKQDLMPWMKKISKFLEVTVSEEEMSKLQGHLSFDSLKKNQSVNFSFAINNIRTRNMSVDKEGQFFRKGIVGDHKSLMSPEVVGLFDEKIERVLNDAGLKF